MSTTQLFSVPAARRELPLNAGQPRPVDGDGGAAAARSAGPVNGIITVVGVAGTISGACGA